MRNYECTSPFRQSRRRPFPVTIGSMRWSSFFLGIALLGAAAFCVAQAASPSAQEEPEPRPAPAADNGPQNIPLFPCGEGDAAAPGCAPSKRELKEAKAAFAKGLKLQKAKDLEGAFDEFQTAARLAPRNVDYVTARELSRQRLAFNDLQRGNTALLDGRPMEALADFQGAAGLDPQNEFARQRVRDAMGDNAPQAAAKARLLSAAGELRVAPAAVRADFYYEGDGRGLLTQVAKAFGVNPVFDESVVGRPVRFAINNVDFYTAMRAACAVTHTFWTPLAEKQILLAEESADNHRKFDRMATRTFFLPGLNTPTDFATIATLLRSLFDIKIITSQPSSGTIAINAPEPLLDAATQFIESLDSSRPEVMLDVRVYQVDHMLTRNLGMQIPNQFQLFNIPAAALAALGGQNIQQLINQLIANGGINQANSTALSALLAQLQGQSQQSSIFSQPVATFGNGKTLMGLTLGTPGVQASINQSWLTDLEHSTLRVSQGNDATFRVGSRYPILNSTFAPTFNSPAIAQVIGNNSFQAPFPSFSYEDLGLSLKAKPVVSRDDVVSLTLDLQLRTLVGQSFNGVPVIANREFQGSLTLMDGQPAVVAGEISRSETSSLTGLPGLGMVPGLNQIMTSNTKQDEEDELLVVITPRVIREGGQDQALVWMPE